MSFFDLFCLIYKHKNIMKNIMKNFDEKSIYKILEKINKSEKLSRNENIQFQSINGTRKANIIYSYNNKEIIEYSKCYQDIFYFAEKYCKIRIEDGSINNFKLRDYQKNILDKFSTKRFFINHISRQMGINTILAIHFLHKILFNENINIGLISNNSCVSTDIVDKMKNIYKLLPFFLKKGIVSWNNKNIIFENGSLIDVITFYNKGLSINKNYDIIVLNDFSKFNDQEYLYKLVIPSISSQSNAQLIINSGSNGNCFFNKLVEETIDGHPNRNVFDILRTYWWQVEGRDEKWKQDEIKKLGSEEVFMQEYGLYFISKNNI